MGMRKIFAIFARICIINNIESLKTTLQNDLLAVVIDSFGAEIHSVTNIRTKEEYLWCGDSRFWGRHSPVLFPIVGRVWDGRYRMDGTEYTLGQHGFARDCEFTPMEDVPDDEAWFALEATDDTLKLFPRRFRLEVGYRLYETQLTVMWRVVNLDDREMCFQIGAHPAFNFPDFHAADKIHGYLCFDRGEVDSEILGADGYIGDGLKRVDLDSEGMIPMDAHTFDSLKTIIIGDRQVRRVSMLDKNRSAYISLLFDAPLVGIWSPSVDAPFICIEPWWGRSDRHGYSGDFSAREYVNTLQPGQTFSARYMVIFDAV